MDGTKHFWRIAIIMSHDGETFFEYNDLEQSILDQDKFENISYFIFYNNQEYRCNTVRNLISDEQDRGPYFAKHEKSEVFKNLDFYQDDVLIKFLKEVVETTCLEGEICHYLIITWGHGGGLVYYPPEDLIVEILKTSGLYDYDNFANKDFLKSFLDSVNKNVIRFAFLKANFSITAVEQPPPFIDISMFTEITELSSKMLEAINKANRLIEKEVKLYTAVQLNRIFKVSFSAPIDIYFALNCYTQMIETGYELAESVIMLAASQTAMPFSGINYYSLFNILETKPDSDLQFIASTITSTFNSKYGNEPFKSIFNRRYPKFPLLSTSFSCNFLEQYSQIMPCLDKMTKLLKGIYDENIALLVHAVSRARYNCNDLTRADTHGLIDLTNFLFQLEIHLPQPIKSELTSIKNEFLLEREKAMASIKPAAENMYSTIGPSDSPYFLSFFAPAFFASVWMQFLLKMYSTLATRFCITSGWDDFAQDFYAKTTKP